MIIVYPACSLPSSSTSTTFTYCRHVLTILIFIFKVNFKFFFLLDNMLEKNGSKLHWTTLGSKSFFSQLFVDDGSLVHAMRRSIIGICLGYLYRFYDNNLSYEFSISIYNNNPLLPFVCS